MPPIHRPHTTAEEVRRRLGPGPHPVFDVHAAGISAGRVRAAVRAGTLVVVRRGVVALPPDGKRSSSHARPPTAQAVALARVEHHRAAAAALATFGVETTVSHASAGLLRGLPSCRPGELPRLVHLTAPRGRQTRRGVSVHHGLVAAADRDWIDDAVLCTSLARTALDVARERPLVEALVPLDAAAAQVGVAQLRSAYSRLPWVHGMKGLAAALEVADPRSESPLESASRGAFLTAGVPPPELQVWIETDAGRRHRVDFLWPLHGVIGEADGWTKYVTGEDLREEKRREDALRRAGFTIVRWTSEELWRDPASVTRRVAAALA